MEPETLPDGLDAVLDGSVPVVPKRHRSTRAVAFALFAGMVLILALLVGWLPTTGIAAAWNQLTHPPFSAAEQQQLRTLVTAASATYTNESSVTVGTLRSVQVTTTVAWTADISINDVAKEQARVKALCFVVQKALWTSRLSSSDVLVIVLGPVTDEYGQSATDAHGSAELSAKTASTLPWAALSPDTAWSSYDHTYLRASYLWYVP